jgi:hypothetical protein
MDASERRVKGSLAVVAAVTSGLLTWLALRAQYENVWRLLLAGSSVAYLVLAVLLAWSNYYGRVGPRWQVLTTRWLFRLLFMPLWVVILLGNPALRWYAARDLALEPDERVLSHYYQRGDGPVWLLSTHALYVGDFGSAFWRIRHQDIQGLTTTSAVPCTDTRLTLTLAARTGPSEVSGVFADEKAKKVMGFLTGSAGPRALRPPMNSS